MDFLNRPAIKADAKGFISQDSKWFKMFLATVLIYIITQSVNVGYRIYNSFDYGSIMYFNDYYSNNNAQNNSISVFSTVLGIIMIPFMTAMCGYYLNHIRGFNPDWRSLYKEGFDNFGVYITVGLITDIIVTLWSLLLIVPGIIMYYAYSQVGYIIHDNNRLSGTEARKISKIMTQGYKAELFVLDLSFILWYMLVGITCGIAGVYVLPYIHTTKAMYYENLKRHAIETGLIAPEAFGMVLDTNAPENNYPPYQDNSFTPPEAAPQNLNYNNYEQPNNMHANEQNAPFTPPKPEDTFNPDVVYTPPVSPTSEQHTTILNGEEVKDDSEDDF